MSLVPLQLNLVSFSMSEHVATLLYNLPSLFFMFVDYNYIFSLLIIRHYYYTKFIVHRYFSTINNDSVFYINI